MSKQKLQELLTKVEANNDETYDLFALLLGGMGDTGHRAYSGSLGAAFSLHKATCPSAPVDIWKHPDIDARWGCTVGSETAYDELPSRAWLRAVLKTLISRGAA